MSEKKPVIIQGITALLAVKLVIALLTLILFYFAKDLPLGAETALAGMRDAVVDQFGLDISDPDYAFGQLIGKMIVPSLLTFGALLFVLMRKFWPTVVVMTLDFLFGLSQGIPIMAVIILILLWTNPSRDYLHPGSKQQNAT